jgi:2-keto-4-pentenoate hydratase/2-oxohepta-3-ene-1,7-dioic acid hydratase in catechol pathway
MKLLRVGAPDAERPAILDAEGQVRDLSGQVPDFAGEGVAQAALARIAALDTESLPVIETPGRIGATPPEEPILFSKTTSCLSGPNDPVIIPRNSSKADWEVELGVIIGRDTLYVSEEDALDHVAGYCVINDVSERAFQIERGGQWLKGKSAPSFGPIGPWIVTADEVPDPQALNLSLSLNGETVQASNTDDMIFSVREIVSYMSQFMLLRAGDIIATGTPSGVGMGMKPQRFLKPGDVMDLTIEGLGAQRQEVVAAR